MGVTPTHKEVIPAEEVKLLGQQPRALNLSDMLRGACGSQQ